MEPNIQYSALKSAVAEGRIVVVVGAGLSMHASRAARCASWFGFLEASIEHAKATVPGATDAWGEAVVSLLTYAKVADDTATLIRAASMVRDKIAENGPQGLATWMADTIGSIEPRDHSWAHALRSLKCPIFTTNYDTLIEQGTGLDSATWTSPADLHAIALGKKPGVGHLHGVWSDPQSIVLTEGEYLSVLDSPAPQAIQKALSTLKSILYVGVGAGLSDPNFSNLLDWHRTTFENSAIEHFRLCREDELQELITEHASDAIVPMAYGKNFDELPAFLDGLAPVDARTTVTDVVVDVSALAFDAITDQIRDDTIVGEVLGEIEHKAIDDLLVPPVLLPVPHEQFVNSEAWEVGVRPERTDPNSIASLDGVVILSGEEHCGLSTALRWLLAASGRQRPGTVPLFVDFKHCQPAPRPIESQLHIQAAILGIIPGKKNPLPAYVAAVDNMTPHAGRLSDRAIGEIANLGCQQLILGCRQGEESELLERLLAAGVRAEVRYVGRLARSDVRKMAKLVSPTKFAAIAESVVRLLRHQNLPRTPFTVSLLISILIKGNDIAANTSHTSILDQYVSLLLGRGDPHDDSRFSLDSVQREAILADIARLFIEERQGSLPISSVTSRVEQFFESLGWTESLTEVLNSFYQRRVLRSEGSYVRFSQDSYLYLFAAKAALDDDDFLSLLMAEPLLFAPILRHFAALKRTSRVLVLEMQKLVEGWSEIAPSGSAYRQLEKSDAPSETELFESDEAGERESRSESGDLGEDESEDVDDDYASIGHYKQKGIQAPFPLTLDEDLPTVLRYSIALDLASTVLRDSDRVSDLQLKSSLLKRVLFGWGSLVDHFSGDEIFRDSFHQAAEAAASAMNLEGEVREKYVEEITEVLPPVFVLSGVSSTLSSRKLLKILVAAVNDEGVRSDVRSATASAMMLYDLREEGWAGHMVTVLSPHKDTWIVASFMRRLAAGAFMQDSIAPLDEADLLAFVADLQSREYRWNSEIDRKAHVAKVQQRLRTKKTLERLQPQSKKEAAGSITEE